jgi:hypothetical protein
MIGTARGIVAWHISKLERPRLVRPQQSHPIADPIVFWPEHVKLDGLQIPPERGLKDKAPVRPQRSDFPALSSVMNARDDTVFEPLLHQDRVNGMRRHHLAERRRLSPFASRSFTDWSTVNVEADHFELQTEVRDFSLPEIT